MNSEQFTWWLQGFFELSNPKTLDENQVQIIKEHLALVFNKVTKTSRLFVPNVEKAPFENDLKFHTFLPERKNMNENIWPNGPIASCCQLPLNDGVSIDQSILATLDNFPKGSG